MHQSKPRARHSAHEQKRYLKLPLDYEFKPRANTMARKTFTFDLDEKKPKGEIEIDILKVNSFPVVIKMQSGLTCVANSFYYGLVYLKGSASGILENKGTFVRDFQSKTKKNANNEMRHDGDVLEYLNSHPELPKEFKPRILLPNDANDVLSYLKANEGKAFILIIDASCVHATTAYAKSVGGVTAFYEIDSLKGETYPVKISPEKLTEKLDSYARKEGIRTFGRTVLAIEKK